MGYRRCAQGTQVMGRRMPEGDERPLAGNGIKLDDDISGRRCCVGRLMGARRRGCRGSVVEDAGSGRGVRRQVGTRGLVSGLAGGTRGRHQQVFLQKMANNHWRKSPSTNI